MNDAQRPSTGRTSESLNFHEIYSKNEENNVAKVSGAAILQELLQNFVGIDNF